MKHPLIILVVEDRANHIADCHAMFEETLPKLPIQVNVLWAKDLQEATILLPKADVVMTDVFFPTTSDGAEEENGKVIVERCLAESKPVVWVTSTYHHGKKTNAVSQWGRERGLEMFDCCGKEFDCDNDHEGQHKPWKSALYGLFCLILSIEDGDCAMIDGKFMAKKRMEERPEDYHKCPAMFLFTVDRFDISSFFWHGEDEYANRP